MSYRVVNGKLYSTAEFTGYSNVALQNKSTIVNKNDSSLSKDKSVFNNILDKQIKKEECFTISSHAAQRLNSRNIDLNDADRKKINEGINMADSKGSKQSLILYKDMALIASIKNRTVITAMDKNQSTGNVITNIDSVVMI
ncbi:TIGR02530 family flagellar biosynthesis protein [Clostridium estertheticum]|uniref:Flagellar biosynthesis protein n=1 Tax=Clostridium estertheticum TaxID=238834 RepID=A0A5N7IQE7_9CLOT|nr:TIGR02530 family flagellar biosynthesis protein [Clostridium estertheticum]MBU3170181.1 flagellar biosynthesis protein [Clostridium estertheticum]MBZ9617041.1 flagellar biosynthesis protein [Clostridium estertheticum subsp. laramiense]MPQ32528.1 flagellar biosynthesis protein [Clostridium estertheticum]MPQ63187.1 flagellar biosynthesis protein [Clostridium estertheticum]WAG72740.1 flagellar biosynthesis protein [Clostridium estertheticum]